VTVAACERRSLFSRCRQWSFIARCTPQTSSKDEVDRRETAARRSTALVDRQEEMLLLVGPVERAEARLAVPPVLPAA